ncbi:histone methyltransferase [Lyophyllum atratum]|nr:histone methyltransferase [Lyophyllum atratum]
MSKRWDVKKEDPRSPSLGLSGSIQDQASFPLSPPSPDMARMKAEEPPKKEERMSPLVLSTDNVQLEPKAEHEPSPSQSPTLNDTESSSPKFKLSPTPTPPPSTTNGTASMSSTPPPAPLPTAASKKGQAAAVQLIGDLPIARAAAMATFNEIPENNYQFKSLGRSREALESMTCDCTFDATVDDPDDACGPDSDCINRLTQVECLLEDCRCRSHCRNQRFQNREYSDIEIVQTEMKGFGLRAESDLRRDAFIYEYVGDVVNPTSFKKRMRDYASEGIEHFYFMMLQKDEAFPRRQFIDATKSGGIGRFANHSCKPNCYVAKWTIGNHVRMGIFAKRNIKQHEELTFNYNVDRYGHQAQTCYCGEPNCVGYIGGKTQTDVVTMDDLYLDALGITDEADLMELKGSKKKKGKKIDDPDFMPILKPIVEKDVPKVVQAIRQTQSRKVLYKLLTRIKMSDDQAALRQIMRLRGYSLMTNVLDDHVSDAELIQLALECMSTWPLVNRNKVEDSRVIVPLIDHWETLPLYNRIPKRVKRDGDNTDDESSPSHRPSNGDEEDNPYRRLKRMKEADQPLGQGETGESGGEDTIDSPPPERAPYKPLPRHEFSRESIQAVIAAAAEAKAAEAAAAEAAAVEAAAAALVKAEARAARAANSHRKKTKPPKKELTQEEKEAGKEKRLLKLVGAVVVKSMSKHSKAMDHDSFKKHAKELTQIIADKEKKSSSYREGKLEKFSEEKIVKIKKFTKEYIAKVLRKLEKSGGKRPKPSSSSTSQMTSPSLQETPKSIEGADVVMADMSVEDIDLGFGSDGDMEDDEAQNGEGEASGSRSPIEESPPPSPLPQLLMDLPFRERDYVRNGGGEATGSRSRVSHVSHIRPSLSPSPPPQLLMDRPFREMDYMRNGEGEAVASRSHVSHPRASSPPSPPGQLLMDLPFKETDYMDIDVNSFPHDGVQPPSDPRRRASWETHKRQNGLPMSTS